MKNEKKTIELKTLIKKINENKWKNNWIKKKN